MRRQAKSGSRSGLLLVEAVLSAVVIATGLVFISRGLASQLGALRAVEEDDRLLSLAHRKLLEWEAKRLSGTPPVQEPAEGTFEDAGDGVFGAAYRWTVTASLRPERATDEQGNALVSEVILTVRGSGDGRSRAITLSAFWPADWVPVEWY